MSSRTPRVWDEYVEDPQEPAQQVWLDRPEWFEWLERERTRRFSYAVFDASVGYIVGFMTVRKERRERGGEYWVAYRRCGGKLRREYVGASWRMTGERLKQLAETFLAASKAVGTSGAEERTGASD